ncbi:MAG: hypothetical protein ACKESB_03585 [Candidatus Hodgkinia cicadicola]
MVLGAFQKEEEGEGGGGKEGCAAHQNKTKTTKTWGTSPRPNRL